VDFNHLLDIVAWTQWILSLARHVWCAVAENLVDYVGVFNECNFDARSLWEANLVQVLLSFGQGLKLGG
jgi:hypothetical protein